MARVFANDDGRHGKGGERHTAALLGSVPNSDGSVRRRRSCILRVKPIDARFRFSDAANSLNLGIAFRQRRNARASKNRVLTTSLSNAIANGFLSRSRCCNRLLCTCYVADLCRENEAHLRFIFYVPTKKMNVLTHIHQVSPSRARRALRYTVDAARTTRSAQRKFICIM